MMSAMILAAGAATRMARFKQLEPFGKSTILLQAVDNLLGSSLTEVILVIGYRAKDIARAVGTRPVKLVVNPNYGQGMSTSIVAGVNSASPLAQAFMIALGDEPCVDSLTISKLVRTFYMGGKGIVVPQYQGRWGHPVIFAARYRNELLELTGDRGARPIIIKHPEDVLKVAVTCPGIGIDVDTPESLQFLDLNRAL